MNLIKYCNCCLNLCRVDKKAKMNQEQGTNTKLETNLEKTVSQSGKIIIITNYNNKFILFIFLLIINK